MHAAARTPQVAVAVAAHALTAPRRPLLTRGGWAAFTRRRVRAARAGAGAEPAAARRPSAAPVRLLRHARRQDHVLRDRRAGDGPDLGLHRHPVARPRPLLRARRLRDGHVPDALDRPRGRLPQRPAGLHGVPRLEGLSLVLELHRPLLVRGAAGRARARRARVRVRLLRVPLADQGRLLLDHHAGADLRVHAAVLPQRHRIRRQQRLHRFQAHPGLSDRRRRRRAWRCSRSPAPCCSARCCLAATSSRRSSAAC